MPARLIDEHVPSDPQAAVVLLHGGGSRRENVMVSPTQLSVLRMIPIAKRIAVAGRHRLAVFRLLNSTRGWQAGHTPVDDAHWALAEIGRRLGSDLPVGLVGHSLGGRAALLAGSAEPVRSVVALAPWLYSSDANPGLSGRKVLIVHGDQDRIASPRNSAAVARALASITDVGYITVHGGKHAMLRRGNRFDALATDFTVATLLNTPEDGAVAQVLAGRRWVEV
jgi:pimeloyl-ACP methyl ester carboxylesterase